MATARVKDTWHLKDRKTRSTRYGIGSRWQVIWTDTAGAEQKRSFKTKSMAEMFRDQKTMENVLGEMQIKEPILWEDYVPIWRSKQMHQRDGSQRNIDLHVRKRIFDAFKGKLIHQVDRTAVQHVVNGWSKTDLEPTTVRLAYIYLRGVFTEALLDERIKKSPCLKIKLPEVEKRKVVPLTSAQVQIIADKIYEPYRVAVIFAAATGVRPGELRGLTADRVDLVNGWVKIDRQLKEGQARAPVFAPLKTDYSPRDIRIGPATIELIRPFVENPGIAGLVFRSANAAITRTKMGNMWRKVRDVHPWIGAGFHQLRHHHASLLIAGGASPVAVAHRLGHKDATETLQTYGHLWPDDDSKLAAMADGLVVLTPVSTATKPLQSL